MTNPDVAPAPEESFETGTPILEVTNLRKYFPVRSSGLIRRTIGQVQAVDGVSFQVRRGSSLGLVGESGCGKSTLGRALIQLTPPTSGTVRFAGVELTTLPREQLRAQRRRMQMIFQDPMSSLDPRQNVESILSEGLKAQAFASSR